MLWRQMLSFGGTGALVGFCGCWVVRIAYKGQERIDRKEADDVRRYLDGKPRSRW
jgi:hypothetical protein